MRTCTPLHAIAQANDRLALKMAHRMAAQCTEPLDDLIQLARIGLWKAAERFNPDNGAAFSSFAVPYIRGEIQHHLRDHWDTVKVPRRYFEAVQAVKRSHRKLEKAGRDIPIEQVAAAHGYDSNKWQRMMEAVSRKPVVALDESMPVAADVDDSVPVRQQLWTAIGQLPKLQYDCLNAHYFQGKSIGQIAKSFRLEPAVVDGFIKEAIASLKHRLLEEFDAEC